MFFFSSFFFFFFFQAEDGIRDVAVTGVQTCALPIYIATNELVLVAPTLERTKLANVPAGGRSHHERLIFRDNGICRAIFQKSGHPRLPLAIRQWKGEEQLLR